MKCACIIEFKMGIENKDGQGSSQVVGYASEVQKKTKAGLVESVMVLRIQKKTENTKTRTVGFDYALPKMPVAASKKRAVEYSQTSDY